MTLLLTHQPITTSVEVDWLTVSPNESARVCDFCYESGLNDIRKWKPIRRFFRFLDECGLIACEHCLPKVTAETEGGAFCKEPNHDRH